MRFFSKKTGPSDSERLIDIDGNVYKTVKIGRQIWMAENLKVIRYRNGDAIPEVTDQDEWADLGTGARCVYDNEENNVAVYGYLYNWYAAVDSRGIAPQGWHVPTDGDWKELEMHLGMSRSQADDHDFRGTNEGSKLAGDASLWKSGALSSHSKFGKSGFSALPGGYRNSDGRYRNMGGYDDFWAATEGSSRGAWLRGLSYYTSEVFRDYNRKQSGYALRLVRD